MLPNLVLHVPVSGMEFLQLAGKRLGFGGGELGFVQSTDGGQNIQRPAAGFDGEVLKGFDTPELRAHFAGRNDSDTLAPPKRGPRFTQRTSLVGPLTRGGLGKPLRRREGI